MISCNTSLMTCESSVQRKKDVLPWEGKLLEFDEMGEKTCRALRKTGEKKLVCYAHLRRQNEQFLQSVNAV